MTLLTDLSQVPDAPGVYMMIGAGNEILYIGKAISLRNRVRSYFQEGAAHHDSDGRDGGASRRRSNDRRHQRSRSADSRSQSDQAPSAAVQRPASRRQTLSVSQGDQRAVSAGRLYANGAKRRRALLRPLYQRARAARADRPRTARLSAANVPRADRRTAQAPVPAVSHPPLPRALRRLSDRRRVRRDDRRGRALPGRQTGVAAARACSTR